MIIKGFKYAAVAAGIRKKERLDLGLIFSEEPATAAGVFTRSRVKAAPVLLDIKRISQGRAQAILVNSGVANACTGKRGMQAAQTSSGLAAAALDIDDNLVQIASTGVIGEQVPVDNIGAAMDGLVAGLSPTGYDEVARAIMTTDTVPKTARRTCTIGGKEVKLFGMAKGAGMIEPGMSPTGKRPASRPLHATMLGFITCDARISSPALKKALREAVALTFNRVTIDGDISTNDTVLTLANGLADNAMIKSLQSPDGRVFQAALNQVCRTLARKIVSDGEGVTRVVTIRVSGAASHADADRAARWVGNSVLVKTSWFGGDPNWGRIIDALGYSPARIVEDKVDIGYSGHGSKDITWSLRRGLPTRVDFATLCNCVAPAEFDLHIRLNIGRGSAVVYACDLSEKYVDFNKGDISDPSALGG